MATATRAKKTQSAEPQQPPATLNDPGLPFHKLKIDRDQVPAELAGDVDKLNAELTKAETIYAAPLCLSEVDLATVTSAELNRQRDLRQESLLLSLQRAMELAENGLDIVTRAAKSFQQARREIAEDEVKTRKRIRDRLLKEGYSEATGQSANQLNGIVNSHPDTVTVRKRVQELIGKSRAAADAAHDFRKYIAAITRDLSQLADDWRLGNAVK